MTRTIDPCDTMRNNLIAAALGLQQCTKTAGTEVLIPGTDKRILIGGDAYLAEVAAPAAAPNCGACPGDGSICPTSCRLAEESPPLGSTTLPEDVAAVFGACGFEIRSTDPAEKHPLAVCGSLDAAGLVVETIMTRLAAGGADAVPEEFMALLPGIHYMDPPDGGDVSVLEQFRRMSEDAARWRETLNHVGGTNAALGPQRFTLRWLQPVDGADIMKGSVAGHFLAAIDVARAAAQEGAAL